MNKRKYWNKERCREIALTCKTMNEFRLKSGGAHTATYKNDWNCEICSHMLGRITIWTKEKCREVALTCKTMNEFQLKSSGAYSAVYKNNWKSEICSHMLLGNVSIWTKERCQDVALRCNSKTEFKEKYISAYNKSWKNKWLDDICSHMIPLGNLRKRLVYSYEFSDNYVYVGLTCNEKRRDNQHHYERSPVKNHITEFELIPIKKILSDGYVDVGLAQELENYWVNKYKNDGWNILNVNKTGGLGGNTLYWTKEKCHEVSLKCKSRKEFSVQYISAYINSRKNKWLDDICFHMPQQKKSNNYWNYETCKKASENYSSRFDFSHKCSGAYFISSKNNWLDDFYPKTTKIIQ